MRTRWLLAITSLVVSCSLNPHGEDPQLVPGVDLGPPDHQSPSVNVPGSLLPSASGAAGMPTANGAEDASLATQPTQSAPASSAPRPEGPDGGMTLPPSPALDASEPSVESDASEEQPAIDAAVPVSSDAGPSPELDAGDAGDAATGVDAAVLVDSGDGG